MLIRLIIIGLLALQPLSAIVWTPEAENPRDQKDEMKQVGELLYSRFHVLGGSCVALGGKWVLTSRHGVESWSADILSVRFRGLHGKSAKIYDVDSIYLPPKGDVALLKLEKRVRSAKKLEILSKAVKAGDRAWIGGYGISGTVGALEPVGKFAAGENRVDGLRGGKIGITMSRPDDKTALPNEAAVGNMDSGSPIFIEQSGGKWVLAGVASSATQRNAPDFGAQGNYARLLPLREWLLKKMGVRR